MGDGFDGVMSNGVDSNGYIVRIATKSTSFLYDLSRINMMLPRVDKGIIRMECCHAEYCDNFTGHRDIILYL